MYLRSKHLPCDVMLNAHSCDSQDVIVIALSRYRAQKKSYQVHKVLKYKHKRLLRSEYFI